jgi:hypothetical protein
MQGTWRIKPQPEDWTVIADECRIGRVAAVGVSLATRSAKMLRSTGREDRMPDKPRDDRESKQEQDDYMRGGKGRKDEVGGSGIYPASSPDAPADAEVRSEGELARHEKPYPKPANEQGAQKSDQSSGSE